LTILGDSTSHNQEAAIQWQPTELLAAGDLRVPVESDVFRNHPDTPFYLGVVAFHGVALQPEEYAAARELRARVYIDEKGFLTEAERDEHGLESDADDARAVHFAVVENQGEAAPPLVVGTSRLILKVGSADDGDNRLPVEKYFPEVFDGSPAPDRSVEVSRFIARHPDKRTQRLISLSLMRAMVDWTRTHLHRPGYAIVEESLASMLDAMDLPYTKLADPKLLPRYQTENMPIQLEPDEILRRSRPDLHVGSAAARSFFRDAPQSIGYFDKTFMHAA
jgi:N-acyl-L-homoserine lactone synthetase